MANRKKLGEILIEQGAATVDALKRGLSLQRQRGGRLGRTLVETKAISESQLARALAAQSRMPLAKMKEEIPSSVTDLVPLDLCRNHQAIAFGARSANGAQTVYIAVADPYDAAAMDAIRSAIGSAVKFALAPASEIARAVARASAERDAAFSRHPEPSVAPEPPAPLPTFEDPPAFGFASPNDDGEAVLDALLGLGPTSLPPPPPSSADANFDDLFDGGMLGTTAPPPPPALSFETDADVFDLSSQAEAVAAYTAEFARAASPPQAVPLEPRQGFLLGEALLDTAPVSLDVGPRLGAAEDLDVPEAVLPGIELTPEEMAEEAAGEWMPEASPWPEEQGHAFDSPLGILPPAPVALDAPSFDGISSTAEDPFTEATRLIDPTALAHLRAGGDLSVALAGAVAPPPELAPQAPANHAPEEDGFDLFMGEDAKVADAPKRVEALGVAPPPGTTFDVPGMEDGWKKEEGEAPRPLDLDAPARPVEPAAGAPLVSPDPPPVVLPDLESLRAELSAYSTAHGAAQVLRADIEAPDGGDLAAPAPVAAPGGEGAEPPAGAAAVAEPSAPRSTALPPPPDLKPVSVSLPLSPAPFAAEKSTAPGSGGEPIEISSDEIVDVEPEAVELAPKATTEPEAKLFDEESVESFGDALGSQTSGPDEGAAPTGPGGSDEGERAAAEPAPPIVPPSDAPSLVPPFAPAGAPQATADVLEILRRIASAEPLVDGMVYYSSDRLARAMARLLSARGALPGGGLDGVLEAPPDKVSLHLVRALLAQALLDPDDLVAMLTTPPDRLNAAVWVRLLERGSVGAEELLGAL
jgi:hypothetical protein